jgi:hypothetical protein
MSAFRPFERPHFFAGRLLSADDLRREQDYQRDKARLRNRFLHGWGIVTGLGVSVDQGAVIVSPGIALDCAGNELVLPEPASVSLQGLTGRHYVTVRYAELPIAPIPTPDGGTEPSAVRESADVELAVSNPLAKHGAFAAGGPGCGQAHALCLAIVSPRGARWRVTSLRRQTLRRRK